MYGSYWLPPLMQLAVSWPQQISQSKSISLDACDLGCGSQQREHHLCRGQPQWMEWGKRMREKWGQRNGNCGNDDDVWQTDKGVVDCCVARVPTWATSLPPSFFLLLPSTRSGKPHKPITNLITCAQLCPQCGDLRPDQVLLSSALAACFMCLVQHVPRRVAAFGSCVSVWAGN